MELPDHFKCIISAIINERLQTLCRSQHSWGQYRIRADHSGLHQLVGPDFAYGVALRLHQLDLERLYVQLRFEKGGVKLCHVVELINKAVEGVEVSKGLGVWVYRQLLLGFVTVSHIFVKIIVIKYDNDCGFVLHAKIQEAHGSNQAQAHPSHDVAPVEKRLSPKSRVQPLSEL